MKIYIKYLTFTTCKHTKCRTSRIHLIQPRALAFLKLTHRGRGKTLGLTTEEHLSDAISAFCCSWVFTVFCFLVFTYLEIRTQALVSGIFFYLDTIYTTRYVTVHL